MIIIEMRIIDSTITLGIVTIPKPQSMRVRQCATVKVEMIMSILLTAGRHTMRVRRKRIWSYPAEICVNQITIVLRKKSKSIVASQGSESAVLRKL